MAVQYGLGVILTVIVLGLQMYFSGLPVTMPFIARFFDVPSLFIVLVFPLIFQCILHGWKDFTSAFSALFKKMIDTKELLKAKAFFENYTKAVFSMAFIAFIFSGIAIITVLENREGLGPNMMIALLVLFYACLINMVIIIPYKTIINKKILEK
ncbi:MAG: hypothetical protein LBG73_01100 [Spirochaetaceae bacterium]|jgi:hypothetical protein|nr:hypothetical protein [Spirochaetaceae bacterium]